MTTTYADDRNASELARLRREERKGGNLILGLAADYAAAYVLSLVVLGPVGGWAVFGIMAARRIARKLVG